MAILDFWSPQTFNLRKRNNLWIAIIRFINMYMYFTYSPICCYLWKIVLSFSFDFSFWLFRWCVFLAMSSAEIMMMQMVIIGLERAKSAQVCLQTRHQLWPTVTLTVLFIKLVRYWHDFCRRFVRKFKRPYSIDTKASMSIRQRHEIVKINNWFLPDWKSKSCSL